MKTKIIIVAVLLLPSSAFAIGIGSGGDLTGCNPYGKTGDVRAPGEVPFCQFTTASHIRLYNLEVAVQALEARNAQLEAKIAATGGAGQTSGSLEARVSALENVTKAIQDSLVMVVNMLSQALNAIKK